MIKKIRAEQLKPGMFIHDFNCSWLCTPFFQNKIKIKDEKTIEKIIKYGIHEVYIDSERGSDVINAQTEEDVKQEIQTEIDKVIEPKLEIKNLVTVQEELVLAKAVKKEAKQVAQNIMNDVKLGKQINTEKADHIIEKMVDSIFRNDQALVGLSRIKQTDEYTFMHSISVSVLMISFSKSLNFSRDLIKEVGIGALLHDIGKMKIPLEVLNKPGSLSNEELEKVKEHVVYSENILSQTPGIASSSILVAAEHHERCDGSGYPKGKKGEDISRYGQMAAIVDVYDAITSDRCYRTRREPTETLRKIFEWSKFHFNEKLVHSFIRCIGIYPVGTLIRLESDFLGIVLDQGENSLLHPIVRVVYDVNKGQFITPNDIDLAKPTGTGDEDRIISHESPSKWNIQPQDYL